MHLTASLYIFLVLVGISLTFLLWVLWSVTKQISDNHQQAPREPMISIRVRDPYAMRSFPARADVPPRLIRNAEIPTRPVVRSTARPMGTTPGLGSRMPSLRPFP